MKVEDIFGVPYWGLEFFRGSYYVRKSPYHEVS